jgi:hypothetical protein
VRLLDRYSSNQNVAGATAAIVELNLQLKLMGITKYESIPYWMLEAMASVISIHGIDTV